LPSIYTISNYFYESDNKSTDINTILHIKFQRCVIGFINRYYLDKMKLYTCNRTSCAYPIELLNWPLLVSLFFLQNVAVCETHAKYTRDTAISNRIKSLINAITRLAYSGYFKFIAAKDFLRTRNPITSPDERSLIATIVFLVILYASVYPVLKKKIPSFLFDS